MKDRHMPDKDQPSRYDLLKDAAAEYGEAAMENLIRCRALGHAVVEGLPQSLGCGPECVSLVPAQGEFDPAKEYGDDAFSFDQRRVIRLEPILFGICLIIPHKEDSGALWLRTGVRLEINGERFDVFVAHQPVVRVPLDFAGSLPIIYDTVYKEFMSVFAKQLDRFNDERYRDGIGFMPNG